MHSYSQRSYFHTEQMLVRHQKNGSIIWTVTRSFFQTSATFCHCIFTPNCEWTARNLFCLYSVVSAIETLSGIASANCPTLSGLSQVLVKRLIFPSSAQMAWKALAQERACSQAGTLKKIWKNKALVTSWPSARSFWSSPAEKALKALKQKTTATWSWGVRPVGTQAIKSCRLRAFCSTDCVMWHGARSMVIVGWQNCCQGLKAVASTSKISHMTGSPWGRPLQELFGYAMSPSTTQSRGPVQACASVATTV